MADQSLGIESWLLKGRPAYDRESVIKLAIDVFNRHGYDATSMGTVAEILGISRPGIYHHVPSKGELLKLGLQQALAALEDIPRQPEANNGPAEKRPKFVLRQMVAALADQLPSFTLLLGLRGNTEIERIALSRRRAFEEEVTDLTSITRDEGSLREDIDPQTAARLLIGTVNSIVDWYDPRSSLTPLQIADEILSVAFHGSRPMTAEATTT